MNWSYGTLHQLQYLITIETQTKSPTSKYEKCGYVNIFFCPSFQAIFRHFQSLQYPEKRNEISDYYSLWKELIRIAKTYKNHRIRIAANLCSVEMFKFMYETENFDCYLREKCICVSFSNFFY